MSEDIGRLFDEAAAGYDRARRRLVPDLDGFYGAALDLVPMRPGDSFRVLDLGSGTGLLAAMVAERFPEATVTLVDFSEGMMEVAKSRLSGERFRFVTMDYAKEALPGEYEVVASALSIHHVEDEAKRRLFGEVRRVLVDGGVFINADQILGETPKAEHENHEAWLRETRELGASERDISSALRRMETDECAVLAAQLSWIREAGFVDVARRYENGRFAVYSGKKA